MRKPVLGMAAILAITACTTTPSGGRAQLVAPPDSLVVLVRGPDTRALEGARVDVHFAPPKPSLRATTDKAGRAAFPVPLDSSTVVVRHLGLEPESRAHGPRTSSVLTFTLARSRALLDVCTMEMLPALTFIFDSAGVRDTVRATVRVRDGSFEQSATVLVGAERQVVGFAAERPGRYDVSVTAPGYAAWRRTGIRVRRDGCHVNTHVQSVRLVPLRR